MRTISSFLQLIEKRNRDLLDAESKEFIYAIERKQILDERDMLIVQLQRKPRRNSGR